MKTIFALLLIISFTFMLSCKKESNDTSKKSPMADVGFNNQLDHQVKWFSNAAHLLKDGKYLKTTEKMVIDSALYYIANTLNYKYGFVGESYSHLEFDTSIIALPYLDDEGKVYVVDALQCYNITLANLRQHYAGILNERKFLLCGVVQNLGPNEDNSAINIRVIGQFGSGAPYQPLVGAMGEWWWERNSYNCGQTVWGTGAPNIIDNELFFYNRPAPAPGWRVYFTGLGLETAAFSDPTVYRNPDANDVVDNFCDYQLYYATSVVSPIDYSVMCLGEDPNHPGIDEMVYYRNNENAVLHNWLTAHNQDFCSVLTLSNTISPIPLQKIKHSPGLTYGIIHYQPLPQPYPVGIEAD